MLRLLLTRHGESEWQVLGDKVGSDSELTKLGQRQADHLGRWLKSNILVDHIYASPLQRAHQTAQLVAAHLGLSVQVLDDLAEAWFWIAPELPGFLTPLAALDSVPTIGRRRGDNYRMFQSQVTRALRDILSRHPDGTILIVAHGGTVETAIRILLGSDTFTVNMGNTTLHSLTWNSGRWHVEYIDRWEHLEGF